MADTGKIGSWYKGNKKNSFDCSHLAILGSHEQWGFPGQSQLSPLYCFVSLGIEKLLWYADAWGGTLTQISTNLDF